MSRRATIAGAGALAGCAHTWPDLPLPADGVLRRRIGDAHVHLFNAADLPIRGFIKYVFVREHLPDLPDAGVALIDFFARILKPFAMTADAELRALDAKQKTREYTPEEYGDAAVLAVRTASEGVTEDTDRASLEEGYNQLAAILALRYDSARLDAFIAGAEPLERDRSRQAVFEEAAREAYRADENLEVVLGANLAALQQDMQLQMQGVDIFRLDAARLVDIAAEIINTIKWGYVMLQPRSSHLDRYIRTYSSPTVQPYTMINLLVDYDKWLRDGPSSGSGHDRQVEFWTRAKAHYGSRIDVRTFASFCPLREAMSALKPGEPTHLSWLQTEFGNKRIAGVKLYPPMGFQASGNDGLDFVGSDEKSIRRRVVTDWATATQPLPAPRPELGHSLDAALNRLYDWCAGHNVPLLAHSGGSNTPAENFKPRPNPKHWRSVLSASNQRQQLRVTFGHFVFDAEGFTLAMENQRSSDDIWALDTEGTPDLLRRFPNTFADISYTDELLGDDAVANDLPRRFFCALKKYCTEGFGSRFGPVDPNFERFLYGSDWIMLGREGAHPSYLSMVRRAMECADWEPRHIENVCERNIKRFLNDPAT